MDEFRVEYYIDTGDEKKIKFSELSKKDKERWKKDMESRAISEYYNKKIKISEKIDF